MTSSSRSRPCVTFAWVMKRCWISSEFKFTYFKFCRVKTNAMQTHAATCSCPDSVWQNQWTRVSDRPVCFLWKVKKLWIRQRASPKSWRRVHWNEKNGAHRVAIGVGRPHLGHFNARDAQRPNVGQTVVANFLDDFGRHPKRRANKCIAFWFCLCQLEPVWGGQNELCICNTN